MEEFERAHFTLTPKNSRKAPTHRYVDGAIAMQALVSNLAVASLPC